MARPLGCDAIEDSRGVAIADLNDDGLLDIVVNNNNAEPAIYLNRLASAGNWMRMHLVAGPKSNRDAIGTRVQVIIDRGGKQHKLTRWVEAGTGYAAQSDIRPHFGLGNAKRIEMVRIVWPDGTCDEFPQHELAGRINTTIRVEQGRGVRDSVDNVVANRAKRNVGGTGR